MGFDISSLIGGSIGDAFQKIVGVFKVDPTIAFQKKTEIEEIQLQLQSKIQDQFNAQLQAQTDINKQEASSQSPFVAGWRPFIGWVCGTGLAIQFIGNPIVTWVAALAKHPVQFPTLDLGTLMTLLFGMLGLGAMRTYEKVQGAPGADQLQ